MNKLLCIACLVLSLVQYSCRSVKKTEAIGPDMCPSSSFSAQNFVFKDNSSSAQPGTLNLSSSFAVVSMDFTESIAYQLTISAPSGAKFVYNGNGKAVNVNWYGNSSNGVFFKNGDPLYCSITQLCFKEPLGAGSLVLNTIISYEGFGFKVTNFEDAGSTYFSFHNTNIANLAFTSATVSSGHSVSPQGGNYLQMTSTSPQSTYYFGGVGFSLSDFTSLGTDPSAIYLNFYAKGTANSQCQLILREMVYGNPVKREYFANVSSDWKLYSVKLADIGVLDPSQLYATEIDLAASTLGIVSTEVDIDLILFTKGAPL
jgi:hypothetical protein